jgi:hypothetical protein
MNNKVKTEKQIVQQLEFSFKTNSFENDLNKDKAKIVTFRSKEEFQRSKITEQIVKNTVSF